MRFDGLADHQVSEAIYIRDPDFNGIEIYCDRPQSDWKWTVKNTICQLQMATLPLDTEDLFQQSTEQGWTGMPARTAIGHVHLHVSNLSNAMKFYHEILGLNLTTTYPDAYFLLLGNTTIILQPIHGLELQHTTSFTRTHRIESFWYRSTNYRRF